MILLYERKCHLVEREAIIDNKIRIALTQCLYHVSGGLKCWMHPYSVGQCHMNVPFKIFESHPYITDVTAPGPTFIKPDQLDPWIKDQITITLLPTISHLLLPNFVSCGRACPSHMTQNLVTVGAKLWTADRFLVDPWSWAVATPVKYKRDF